MNEWVAIGEIAMLQVQRAKLVSDAQFNPAHIATCERLRLTPDGVYGLVKDSWILDKHHRHHPDSQHWNEARTLSVGFTSHYAHMWDLFRQTPLGSAGENMIVTADGMVTIDDIGGGVRIETQQALVELVAPAIAEPCVGFTRFMTERPRASASEIDGERQKLRNGVRGYVMGLVGLDYVEIAPGDKLSIRAS